MKIFTTGFLLCLAATYCSLCYAQTNTSKRSADSLLLTLKTASADTFQLNALHRLGRYYYLRQFQKNTADLDSALFFFNKELAANKNMDRRLENLSCIGEAYLGKNDLERGTAYFGQVTDQYRKARNKKMEGRSLLRYGRALAEISWTVPPPDLLKRIIKSYEAAINCFVACNDAEDEILAFSVMGAAYTSRSQFGLAEAAVMKAVQKYKGRSVPQLAGLYVMIAYIHRYRGNLDKALFYTIESEKILENCSDKVYAGKLEHMVTGELAEIYDALGQTENSIIWYKKTLALRDNMPMPLEFKYRTAGFLIKGLLKQRKYNEALQIALSMEQRHPPVTADDKAIISYVKAYCYDALGQNKRAEELYLLALKTFNKNRADEINDLLKNDITKFYIKLQQYQKAAVYNTKKPTGFSVIYDKEYYFVTYKIDSAAGNFAAALKHHIAYKLLNDSIFNKEKNRQLQQLQVQYETGQKERDISALKKDRLNQQEQTKQARYVRNLTLAGSALLLVLLALIYRNYQGKQRSNVLLNALIIEKDDLIKDKEWLIKEVHHRVKNNLQIVMGLLQRQSAYIDDEAALQAIQDSENRMQSIALIHQKLYQSESLDLIYMPEYIDELTSYLTESVGSRIVFQKDIDEIGLDVAQAVPLGLILNEGITNAVKYAYPGEDCGIVRIVLKRVAGTQILLVVEDQGRGLPEGFDTHRAGSMGMNLMKGLSKQIGGQFEIIHEGGVRLRITFEEEHFVES